MDLDSLKFIVETNQLESAITSIEKLGTAVQNFHNIQKDSTSLDKASTEASIANAKAKKAEFEAMEAESKALVAQIDLKKKQERANKDTSKSQSDLNKVIDDSVQVNDKSASSAEKLVLRQEIMAKLLGEGLTRGAASTLASFKLLGVGTDDLESRLRQALDTITSLGKNPFDSNIGALKSINHEFEALTNRANLLTAGISLNSKQLFEYSRIAQEISARLSSAGIDVKSIEGQELYNKTLKESQTAYLETATKVNLLHTVEKERNDALRIQEKEEARRAKEFLTQGDHAVLLFRKNEQEKADAADRAANSIIIANKNVQESIERTNAIAKMVKNGTSQAEATQRYDLAAAGVETAAIEALIRSKNELIQVEKERVQNSISSSSALTKQERERESALKRVNNEEEKMLSVLHTLNDAESNVTKTTERHARSIANYEKNLRQAGITGDEYSRKLTKYRQQQEELAAVEQKRQINFLQRGLQPQIGDVAVSLASGQRPLTVLLQQGDQIRGLIVQTGLEGVALKKAFEGAMSGVLVSIKQTAEAMLSLLGGAITTIGKSIYDLAFGPLTLFVQTIKDMVNGTRTAEVTLERLKIAFSTFTKVAGIGLAIALAAGVYELYQMSKASDELTKTLVLQGGTLGLNTRQANEYAASLSNVHGGQSAVLDVISEMAKKGGFISSDIEMVTNAATEMQRVAGVAVKDTVDQFAKLKEKPVEALTELAIATGNISVESIKLVQSLEMQGRHADAAKAAMQAFADSTPDQVKKITEQYTWLGSTLETLGTKFTNLASSFKDFIHGLFVTDVLKDLRIQAKELDDQIKTLKDEDTVKRKTASFFGQNPDTVKQNPVLQSLMQQRKIIQDQLFDLLKQDDVAKSLNYTRAKEAKDYADAQSYRIRSLSDIAKKEEEIKKIEGEIAVLRSKGKQDSSDDIKYRQAVIDKLKTEVSLSKNPNIGFNAPNSNEGSTLTKQYKSDLDLIKKITDNQRNVLKTQYEERLIDRAEYTSKDLELLKTSSAKQLNLSLEYEKNVNDIYVSSIQEAIKNRDKAISSTVGKPDQEQRTKEIYEKYTDYVTNLGNSYASTSTDIQNFRIALASTINEKELSVLKTFYEDTKANEEASQKFLRSRLEVIEARKIESDLEDQMQGASDAERARLTAMAKAQKAYADEIIRTNAVLDKANQAFEGLLNDPNASDRAIEEAFKARQSASKVVEKTISESRVDIQNEGTAAILDYYKKENLKLQDDLTSALVDSFMNGGKNGAKKFRDLIISELSKPVTIVVRAMVETLFNGTSQGIMSLLGGNNSAGGTNLLSAAQGASSAYKLVSSGFNVAASTGNLINDAGTQLYKLGAEGVGNALGAFGVGFSSGTSSIGGFMSAFKSGGAELAGSIAGSVLNGFSGFGLSKFISGGYKTSLFGNSLDYIGGALSAIPGVGPIAGVITGAINRLFGRKLKKAGIEGVFGGDEEFVGNNYKYYKGGLFASNKTKRSPLDEATRSALGDRYELLADSASALGSSLGLGTSGVDNFNYKVKLNFKGKSQDEITKLLDDTFNKISESLAKAVLGTDQYKKGNETSLETLTRLSTSLVSFNKTLETLGISTLQASLANADLTSRLADAAGGMSSLQSTASSFYNNFYTTAEKTALTTKTLTAEFAKLGINSIPKTREEFKKLVQGLDLTTEQGQKSFLGFLGLADALNSILPPLDDAQTAADNLKSAFQSLTDGIFNEVQRIRTLLNQDTPNSFANAQSDFAIATAQARAGDQTAAGNLPALSQALLGLAENQATSSVDLKRIQNQVLLSLEGTGQYLSSKYGTTIPGFEKGYGAGLTLTDTLALPVVAPVPASISTTGTAAVTAGTSGTLANNSRLEDLVQVLQQSVENLRAEVRADVAANVKTATILTRVSPDGESLQTTVI